VLGNGKRLHLGITGVQKDTFNMAFAQFEQTRKGIGRDQVRLTCLVFKPDAVFARAVPREMDYLGRVVQEAAAKILHANRRLHDQLKPGSFAGAFQPLVNFPGLLVEA
jgi:hypothetical protein